jgi:hypothetical protein
MDCLRFDVLPEQDINGDGCYDWMAIRAGKESKFCEDVEFGSDIAVAGEGDFGGDVQVGGNLQVNNDVNINNDLNVDGTIFWNNFEPPSSGGGEIPPYLQTYPMNLVIEDSRQYNSGDIFPPENFKWDISTNRPQTEFTGPPVTIDYQNNNGFIFLNRNGVYDIEMSLTINNESPEANPDRLTLFLAQGTNLATPDAILLACAIESTGQDGIGSNTHRRVLNVFNAPIILQTALQIIDNAPGGNSIIIQGSFPSVPKRGLTSLNIQWINDTPQLPEDVRPA